MSADDRSDDELLCACDADSFAVFYRRHVEWVLGYLQRRTRNPELAADLAAEVFAAAFVARRRYEARDGTANSWLFRIALNKLTDSRRRGYAEESARRRLRMERVVADEHDLRWIESLGDAASVTSLVQQLPADQRAAVTARVVEERDYPEISERLGISEAASRKRVSRGLAALRTMIGPRR
jgi:RNA polymerase sigma factor (sigma-70 family)